MKGKANTLDRFLQPKQRKDSIETPRKHKQGVDELNGGYKPLAEKQRPKKLEDIIGQEDVLGIGTPFNTMIKNDTIQSTILYGPPGCGKTTIAKIIQETTKSEFVCLSATTARKEDFKKEISAAKQKKQMGVNTILFLDEIHSLNKLQQDTFLPAVENGTIVLIGATTENPSFELNNALMSRCQLVVLRKLNEQDIVKILRKAIDEEYTKSLFDINPDGLAYIAAISEGDARNALNTLEKIYSKYNSMSELALQKEVEEKGGIDLLLREKIKKGEWKLVKVNGKVLSIIKKKDEEKDEKQMSIVDNNEDNDVVLIEPITITDESEEKEKEEVKEEEKEEEEKMGDKRFIFTYETIENYLQRIVYQPQNQGEGHYTIMNAFHKSITHSDTEASVYWLERLIQMGANPKYITRRMIRISSEDVGLADVEALSLAVKTFEIVSTLGYPECNTALYECACYLARAPKSCAVLETIRRTEEVIKQTGSLPVPLHIRNAPTELMDKLGYSHGYKYPPDYNEVLDQTYLPQKLVGAKLVFYDKFVPPIKKEDVIMTHTNNN